MSSQTSPPRTFSELAFRLLAQAEPRLQRSEFCRNLDALIAQEGGHIGEVRAAEHLRPDGYVFDESLREVIVYEIEDEHPLTIEKLEWLVDLFWGLDENYWTLRLIVLDRYGLNRREIDLYRCHLAIYGPTLAQPWRIQYGRIHLQDELPRQPAPVAVE